MFTSNDSTLGLLREKLGCIPRAPIALRHTPLQHLPRLSARLGGPDIYIKRDDLTDLALGGNKARIMEYVMADALGQDADIILQTATTQSNLCRQTAAAARKAGLEALLVLRGAPGDAPRGNLLLDVLLGANIHFIDTQDDHLVRAYIRALMEELHQEGKRPYFFDAHSDMGYLATFAYLDCYLEIVEQIAENGIQPAAIFIATSSGGTQSGLDLGAAIHRSPVRVIGINPMSWSAEWIRERDLADARRAASILRVDLNLAAEQITVLPDYVGEAYGIPTPMSSEAQNLFALDEAILLDSYYTAKAAGAMIDLIRKGHYTRGQSVIFIHTGGVPSLFAAQLPYDSTKIRVLTEREAIARTI